MAQGKRGRPEKAHGVVYPHRGYFYLTLAVPDEAGRKKWLTRSSGVPTSENPAEHARNERKAENIRRQAQNALSASHEGFGTVGTGAAAGVTVGQLAMRFFLERERLKVKSWKSERQRLSDYVLPEIGSRPVVDVRPRHLIEAYGRICRQTYRTGKLLSQKTIDETHRTLEMLFNFAAVMDLVPSGANPCQDVGPRYRKSSRAGDARKASHSRRSYSLSELATLVSSPRIPLYWRCLFAVESLAMTRAGEAGRLRFADWDRSREDLGAPPGHRGLGQLFVDGQKTSTPRWVPVHPALRELLTQWRERGFSETFGREPTEGDLMFPYVRKPGSRKAQGTPVTTKVIWKELQVWLGRLGLVDAAQPTRPQHGLRRAGSAAMADAGVSPHDRRCITHAPDLSNMQERYDAPSWKRLSECILKIQLGQPLDPNVEPLGHAGGPQGKQGVAPAAADFFGVFSVQTAQPADSTTEIPVEAAGIEPASGSLRPFDPTCVVRALFRPNGSHGRDSLGLSWNISPLRAQAHAKASPHYDGLPPAHRPRPGRPRA